MIKIPIKSLKEDQKFKFNPDDEKSFGCRIFHGTPFWHDGYDFYRAFTEESVYIDALGADVPDLIPYQDACGRKRININGEEHLIVSTPLVCLADVPVELL